MTARHLCIMAYDPLTKKPRALASTYRNQHFKDSDDLDFDAEGNLCFTDTRGRRA